MKGKILIIFYLCFLLFNVTYSSTDYDLLKIRVNGNDHPHENFIARFLHKEYINNQDKIRTAIDSVLRNNPDIKADEVYCIYLASDISDPTFSYNSSSLNGNLYFSINKNGVSFKNGETEYIVLFDIKIKSNYSVVCDSFGYYLEFEDETITFDDVKVQITGGLTGALIDLVGKWLEKRTLGIINSTSLKQIVEAILNAFIDNKITKKMDIKPLTLFNFSMLPGEIRDINAVGEAINSFPIEIKLYSEGNYDILEINFMKGTNSNPDAFVNITPVQLRVILLIG